jgi:hypothetical protein
MQIKAALCDFYYKHYLPAKIIVDEHHGKLSKEDIARLMYELRPPAEASNKDVLDSLLREMSYRVRLVVTL